MARRVALIVLDGWGIAPASEYNAISLARKPNFDYISKKFGVMQLCASGTCVGLEEGQMGNSEVGHLTIGAGRVILQDQTRIDDDINSGQMAKNHILSTAIRRAVRLDSTIHFVGLLSDSGVHSQIRHLFALIGIAAGLGAKNLALDPILDGRDTPPESSIGYISKTMDYLKSVGAGRITTMSGRYYAMDRDNRWDRTRAAYDAIVYGKGEPLDDPIAAVRDSYREKVTDEFFVPHVADGYEGLRAGDLVILFNFRQDRMRQLAGALSGELDGFGKKASGKLGAAPGGIELVSMTMYDEALKNIKPIIRQESVRGTLSSVIAKNGIMQFHVAETEKYAHVTYFFNGLTEKPERMEERALIPSPKVDFYYKTPRMSAGLITDKVVGAIESQAYGFILANFANADMVGHTGKLDATVKAIEAEDGFVGMIFDAYEKESGNLALMITADHGNAEKKFDPVSNQPSTSHTSNPVPFIVVSDEWKLAGSRGYSAGLRDVAPSVLDMMGLRKPAEMTGRSLVTTK
jgi:2,3-bisphosphoglycerate-independent phosphoglycerate mutase